MWSVVGVLLCLLPSCALTPRVVRLKNYEPIVAVGTVPELAGKRIYLADVTDGRSDTETWESVSTTPSPLGYVYSGPSSKAADAWDAGMAHCEGDTAPRHRLGAMRNMYGAKTAEVVALDSPLAWMQETLTTELGNQHALLAVSESEADASISLKLRHIGVDMYFSIGCHIAADVAVSRRDHPPKILTIHTKGSCWVWTGSSWEYYTAMREAQQKLMWHALRAIVEIDPPPSTAVDKDGL